MPLKIKVSQGTFTIELLAVQCPLKPKFKRDNACWANTGTMSVKIKFIQGTFTIELLAGTSCENPTLKGTIPVEQTQEPWF